MESLLFSSNEGSYTSVMKPTRSLILKRISGQRMCSHGKFFSAAESLLQGELLMEYTGELIRRPIADLREKHGRPGIYFFTVEEDFVLDGTNCGGIARFINHSCRSLPQDLRRHETLPYDTHTRDCIEGSLHCLIDK